MQLKGIVNRIWQDPSEVPPVVSLMLQGDKTIHRVYVHEACAEEVGLTKPGDQLELVMRQTPMHPSVTQWNNETLTADCR